MPPYSPGRASACLPGGPAPPAAFRSGTRGKAVASLMFSPPLSRRGFWITRFTMTLWFFIWLAGFVGRHQRMNLTSEDSCSHWVTTLSVGSELSSARSVVTSSLLPGTGVGMRLGEGCRTATPAGILILCPETHTVKDSKVSAGNTLQHRFTCTHTARHVKSRPVTS